MSPNLVRCFFSNALKELPVMELKWRWYIENSINSYYSILTESVNLWPQQPESLTVKCNYIIGSLSNTSPRHGILWGHCDKSFLWQKYDILYQILSRKKNRNFGGGKRLSSRCIANGKISRYSVKRFDSIAHALVVTLLNKSTELTFSS